MAEDELVKVKLLDTLERALRAYEVGAFPDISSELFKELVTNVQALLEEDAGKAGTIASLQAELEDARNTLNSARKVIDQLECSVQAQEHQQGHEHHVPQDCGIRHSASSSNTASSALSNMPHDGSKEAQSPNSPPCSLSLDASTFTGGSHQCHSDTALYQNLAELQEERQQLKLQVESLQQDLANHSRHAQQELASQHSSHMELQAALSKAQQQLEHTRVSMEREVAQWQKAAEHAADVAEAAQAQVDQLKADLSSAHALVNAHERNTKRVTSIKLELEHACALLDKREQSRSEMDTRLVCPLLTWYARIGYPQEQQRRRQADHEPSSAIQPPTPAKCSGKADMHRPSTPTIQAHTKDAAHRAAGASKLHCWRGGQGSGSGVLGARAMPGMGAKGGLISQKPPEQGPGVSWAHKGQDGWAGSLPEPVPLVPLPPRSHTFRVVASHAGAVLGPIACEVDSAADRRLEVAVAATQLLMGRMSDVDALKQDVQAQLVAASDRYQRMETGMLQKHAKEVADLNERLKAASLALADMQRQTASLQAELGSLQRDRANAVMQATQLHSEVDALMAKVQQKSLAAEASAKDFAAQLKALAEEKHCLQRQLIDAKQKVQATNEKLFLQETAAAARLQECLVQQAQEQAAALAQEQGTCQARLEEELQKAASYQGEAQLRQDHQASIMQAEHAAKLHAAHLRLQDSEHTNQRAQAHLRSKIEELEKEAAREQSRLRQVEGELRCQKAHVKDMELKQGSAESSISSLKLEIEQLQESLQNVRSQALQQAKEKDDLVAQLQLTRLRVKQMESAAEELEVQKLGLSRERDDVAATLHRKVTEFHQRFASLGDAQQALSMQLRQRSKQDEAEIYKLQQDLSRSIADRSSLAAELEELKGAMQELRSGISAAEQAADHALQARDVARAAMEQHKGAVEAMREQQAQQEAQHQLQLAKLQIEMQEQQREAEAKLALVHAKQQQLWNALRRS